MLKKFDPKIEEQCIQHMQDHVVGNPIPTATALVVAKHYEVGAESVGRWYSQVQVDAGRRHGTGSE